MASITNIVRSAGNFNEKEIEIAIELVEETLSGEEDYLVFVIEDDSAIVRGFVCYGPIPLTEGSYDLYWIAVEPSSQRAGYGRTLIQFVEKDLRERGARLLLIETSSTETYAGTLQFYEKAGYVLVSRIEDFYRPGDAKLTFAKTFRYSGNIVFNQARNLTKQ